MRMERLHVNGKLHPFIPINIEAIDTETDVWINTRYRCHKIDETVEQAEAEINAALRDVECVTNCEVRIKGEAADGQVD